MNYRYLYQTRCPQRLDLIALGLMSIEATLIAALFYSSYIFYSGHSSSQFYNVEFWRLSKQYGFWSIGIPTLISFLILLPFRKRTLLRWIFWICCTVFWIGALFIMGNPARH